MIPNSASVRVTRPGLDFISSNLGNVAGDLLGTSGGVINFNINLTPQSLAGLAEAYICSGGSLPSTDPTPSQCVANINIGGAMLHVDALAATNGPNGEPALSISGTVPVKVDDIPVDVKLFSAVDLGTLDVGVGQGGCNGNTPNVTYANVPVTAVLPIISDTMDPRNGYAAIDTSNAVVNANIDTSIVQLCGSSLAADIASALKSTVVGALVSPIESTLKNELTTNLCTKPTPMVTPPCPNGSEVGDAGNCVFNSAPGTCVPTLLGLMGHLDLGSLLAKYSPGNPAAVDLVLAGAGAAQPAPYCPPNTTYNPDAGPGADCVPDDSDAGYTPNGLTLGMLGGMLPSPTTNCVPLAQNDIPMGIPIPDEIMRDKISPWSLSTGPDINLALAGRFLTYAATSAYNSGVLCLGISTEQLQLLSTGLVSAIIPSIKDLTFEPGSKSKPQSMAITTRPQKPPTVSIGGGTDLNKDPLISVSIPSFAIDFYVWSDERYVRVFTYTADVKVPINLTSGKTASNPNDGIVLTIGDLVTANGVVTNSNLIWEKPANVAGALSSLLGSLIGQFLGSGIAPINLNSAFAKYGIALSLPSDAFRKLTKGTDNFVGLFGNLVPATAAMVDTKMELKGLEVHPEAMGLFTAVRSKFPKLTIDLSSPDDDGTKQLEYAYWIDDQPRSMWTQSREVVVDSQYLFLQGKHTIYAAARQVNHPESEDTSPAQGSFIIDVLPPVISLQGDGANVTVQAYDYVSDDTALVARYHLVDENGNEGPWTEWRPYTSLGPIAGGESQSVEAQVRDEAGNIGDVSFLIRGRPDPTIAAGSSACGCSTPGRPGTEHIGVLAAFGAIAAIAIAARRRRSGRGSGALHTSSSASLSQSRAGALVVVSLGVVAAATPGCSCGSSPGAETQTEAGTTVFCGPGCAQPCGPANLQGLIGEYTSYAIASDGTVWVAGYNDADVTNGLLYGDLVAGKYDTGKQKVDWVDVDGLPPEPAEGDCPPNPPNTWRNGLTDPGPDVGLWTSIQLDSNNNPMISYYDATDSALKFASSPDGGQTWHSHTVMQVAGSDVGRYSKMLVVNGVPLIAFLVIEPGMNGWTQSRVVLATGNVATPAQASDWQMQNALVDPQTPCRAQFCPSGTVCVQSTFLCQPAVMGCKPSDCGASEAGIGSTPESCVTVDGGASCQAVETTSYVDTYPDAEGDYITIANGKSGIAIIVYDRTRGNLVGVANQGGAWNSAILDGQIGANNNPMRTDTGDVGVGASLTIDSSGNWNVSYVNGWTEALEYLMVPAGNISKPGTPEVVDDGLHLDGMLYPDGQHIVGDDSSISVDASGAVRVVYMDATAGTLHEAVGSPASGNKHTWNVKALSQASSYFAGYFPHYLAQPQMIGNWYRATDHTMSPPVVTGDVALVSP